MKNNKYEIDMCNGTIMDKLISFAFPLMLSGILQLMFNAVDIIVVGRFSGSQALAAVGSTTALINVFVNLFIGISLGANVLAARFYAAGREEEMSQTVHTAITLALISGVAMAFVGVLFAKGALELMGTPDDVIGQSTLYMRIYFMGMPFFMLYNYGAAILRAVGDTKRPLFFLIISGCINAGLNLILVIGFHLDVAGVAIATIISQTLSAAYVFYFLRKKAELKVRVLSKGEWKACRDDAKNIVSLGSAGFIMQLTNSLVTICCNSVLSGIGGDVYISVMTIVSSVRQMVETPIYAINEGTSPILSYNYGARRPMKVKKAIRVLTCMILIYTAITWSVIIFEPEFLIGIFSTDRELLADCVDALKLYFAAFIFMDLQYVGQTVFKSLNKKKQAIFFSLLRKVFIVVPLTYLFPYAFHMGTRGVFLAEPISNVIGGSLCFITMLVMLKRSI